MVEVSSLRDLDIYTVHGKYVGKVEDVVLNIRLGTISKLVIRALEPQHERQVGFRQIIRSGLQMVPEEDEMRSYQEGLLTIGFDKVTAIGDIMLINTPNVRQQIPNGRGPNSQRPVNPETSENPEQPGPQVPKPEAPNA
ncbi:MAG: PRC-barrel domain-containing protein [Methanobrevibacter boviskoreani]|jgi:sporulation protein YlmC with PRC-barrel domain|uniref:PRC-barrel domain-containing protein n=2 Tax=Methanobrevibacter boviskoreani TaxID=1348249 RepID=UPI0006ACDF8C|nr:PRC-barrel domain-containing protein [Methanobrevibacter boviskoreani]MCI6775057.1 PRC-barrel domain-containing protein [Methanobrevibacter boviskoreani]MDD6256561.1 PRC-barrel domain-containing protein [Methanobrevibacter boviskoreani]MDY5614493.1 PRC-barrel domain-containing protein [Methanobrevibacter boviskoreani]